MTSSGLFGFTVMLPAEAQRIWWPQTVCRPITDHGISLRRPPAGRLPGRAPKRLAAVGRPDDEDLRIEVLGRLSQAASFWEFRKWMYRSPFGRCLRDRELILVARVDPTGPVLWNVQLGWLTAIERGFVHVRPPSSDQLRRCPTMAYDPCNPFTNSVVVT